ncbi:MAG: hydantoinase B/oxoprolinase family protein [Rhodococcus sp. (in: high G+C Gram-positive bacteria)]|nr:MAG: hydantoinase B/oxoprolinase family protein [Rhodococcus sp. (in: high G+C Gram-positive bacteria)]
MTASLDISTTPDPTNAFDTLLRDLSDDDFAERYGTDPFTATVLSNRLRFAAQHVATGLLYRAFSPIIALAMDYVCAICGPPEQNYRMVTATNGLSIFLGTIQDGVRIAVEEYGIERLVPGDLLICNDPTRMGNHANDVCFIRPVFHEGRIISFMVLRAHVIDVGGVTPGGFSTTKQNLYESGLVISPRLLFHAEEPVRETFSMIFDNARFGEVQLPDYKTIHGCCRFGETLIRESVERYGVDAYLGTLNYSCDVSAEKMHLAISQLPDGDYRGSASLDADAVADDEEYRVVLHLRKRADRIEVDFSGSSRQARSSINAGPLDAKTGVGVGLKMMLDPRGHFTSGSYRPLDIVLPPGSIASALPPDGAIFYFWEVQNAIMTALVEALGDVLGEKTIAGDCGSSTSHNAYGVSEDGEPWACSAMAGAETGPIGADSNADGEGQICAYLINIISPSTEGLEAQFPVMVMRKEYTCDSSGAGTHRGGPSILKDIMWTAPAEHQTGALRFRYATGLGVEGGRDGAQGGVWIFDQDGRPVGADGFVSTDSSAYASSTPVAGLLDPKTRVLSPSGLPAYPASEIPWRTGAGATWRYTTNAGGGWGRPEHRDPDAVRRDVRDGYVSIDEAANTYRVRIIGDPANDPEGLQIDHDATAGLRAADGNGPVSTNSQE